MAPKTRPVPRQERARCERLEGAGVHHRVQEILGLDHARVSDRGTNFSNFQRGRPRSLVSSNVAGRLSATTAVFKIKATEGPNGLTPACRRLLPAAFCSARQEQDQLDLMKRGPVNGHPADLIVTTEARASSVPLARCCLSTTSPYRRSPLAKKQSNRAVDPQTAVDPHRPLPQDFAPRAAAAAASATKPNRFANAYHRSLRDGGVVYSCSRDIKRDRG